MKENERLGKNEREREMEIEGRRTGDVDRRQEDS